MSTPSCVPMIGDKGSPVWMCCLCEWEDSSSGVLDPYGFSWQDHSSLWLKSLLLQHGSFSRRALPMHCTA